MSCDIRTAGTELHHIPECDVGQSGTNLSAFSL